MPAPGIEVVKVWCRIDGDAFDALLPTQIDSATRLAGHETGRGEAYYLDDAVALPTPVLHWVCAQVAHWINNPEAASEKDLKRNPFLDRLLDPYRSWS